MSCATSTGSLTIRGAVIQELWGSLQEHFGQRFNLWLPGEPWQYVSEHLEDEAASKSSVSDTVELLHGLKLDSNEPRTKCLGPSSYLLILPIESAGKPTIVATARFFVSSPSLLMSLAESFLKYRTLRRQMGSLKEENKAFVAQVTQDFEELTFLREMAKCLEITDVSSDTLKISEQALPILMNAVHSESIVVMLEGHWPDSPAQTALPLVRFGADTIDDEMCRRIVFENREKAILQPVVKNHLKNLSEGARYPGLDSFVLVPHAKGDQILGWILAINRVMSDELSELGLACGLGRHEFGTVEATILSSLASILATHSTNVQLFLAKEELLVNVVRALVNALDAKDEYTRGHSERVALFSQRLSIEFGYNAAEQKRLYLTGLVHDVGKIGVSDHTLAKPGRLTVEEFAEIARHPDEGWSILCGLEELAYVLPGVLYHHERYDGTGYPDGLIGEKIPLDGRLIAVADAYDAMTSDRPYRKGMPQETAMSIFKDGRGTQWDPQIVNEFLRIMPEIIQIRKSYQLCSKPKRR